MPDPINDAESYGVRIAPVSVADGEEYWRVTRVHHLTPVENGGKHHIYIDAMDADGNRMFGQRALITWEGGSQEVVIEKPLNEPGGNFPMFKWMICRAEMMGLPSDGVENLRTDHPDEAVGNTLFHHSFAVDFRRSIAGEDEEPPDTTQSALAKFVLFGPPDLPATQVYLTVLADYLAENALAFGFSLADALKAGHVTLVGVHPQSTREALQAANIIFAELPIDPGALLAAIS
ncbi:MAG: hypothetical protein J5I90_09790 [Caldilineales bacterium]|nr:hypothetical protein [Caldilineales bacterium]